LADTALDAHLPIEPGAGKFREVKEAAGWDQLFVRE
jgi:hypothetical protein